MNTREYLARIRYDGPVSPTLEVLSQLQLAHLLTVPFENLDIQNKVKIDFTNLFDKIVTRKRGGFCYELNGLFCDLLKEIGFVVKMVSARVYDGKKDYSPEFDHLALVVSIEGDDYLVDVGFGEFAFSPIKLQFGKESNDPRGIFLVEPGDDDFIVIEKKNAGGQFLPEYMFTPRERQMTEFYDRCNYHQTNPGSHFMEKTICSLPTKDGRITLTGDLLKITAGQEVRERRLATQDEIKEELLKSFGIVLN